MTKSCPPRAFFSPIRIRIRGTTFPRLKSRVRSPSPAHLPPGCARQGILPADAGTLGEGSTQGTDCRHDTSAPPSARCNPGGGYRCTRHRRPLPSSPPGCFGLPINALQLRGDRPDLARGLDHAGRGRWCGCPAAAEKPNRVALWRCGCRSDAVVGDGPICDRGPERCAQQPNCAISARSATGERDERLDLGSHGHPTGHLSTPPVPDRQVVVEALAPRGLGGGPGRGGERAGSDLRARRAFERSNSYGQSACTARRCRRGHQASVRAGAVAPNRCGAWRDRVDPAVPPRLWRGARAAEMDSLRDGRVCDDICCPHRLKGCRYQPSGVGGHQHPRSAGSAGGGIGGDPQIPPVRHRPCHQSGPCLRFLGGVHHCGVRGHCCWHRHAGGQRRTAQPGSEHRGHGGGCGRVPAGARAAAEDRQPAGLWQARNALRGAFGVLCARGRELRRRAGVTAHGTGAGAGDWGRESRGLAAQRGRPARGGILAGGSSGDDGAWRRGRFDA